MLCITVISHNAVALEPTISAEFDTGGTIGRAPGSTLLLPDPDRVISRTHAVVSQRDGAYYLRDQGTTVPVLHNGRPVGHGHEIRLAQDAELRIGAYMLRARLLAIRDDEAADATIDSTVTATLRPGTMLSWDEGGGPAPDRIETVFVTSSGDAPPLAPMPAAAATVPAAESPAAIAPRATLPLPRASTGVLQQALLRGAGMPDLTLPNGLTPALMEQLGQVMREALRGLIDLLVARAQAKREVRADATIIVAQDNNPLKFDPDLDAVIRHLLEPRGQGFMPPLQAISDAQESLRSHQLGFVAGMRAAFEAVVARFDPAQLEARLTAAEPVNTLLPVNHRAKLWDMYEELYEQISREAATDFHQLFGEQFLRAYQAKIDAHRERREADGAS